MTGTNGKTTTTLPPLLDPRRRGPAARPARRRSSARIGGEVAPAVRTTPEAIDLQRAFREMLDAGDRSCAMEATSHGSELRRLDRVRFAALVFTNLSQDHLDFHGTMERYFEAKRRLFLDGRPAAPRSTSATRTGGRLADERPGRRSTLRLRAQDAAELGPDALRRRSTSKLRGRFNVENVLGARRRARGCSASTTRRSPRGLAAVPGVPGPLRGGGRGPAVRGPRRLRAQARRARERAPRGAGAR